MSYRVVKGAFHLFYHKAKHVGSRPDGDSVWFKPTNPGHLKNLGGPSVDFNGGGFAQLRFEGIDALELHYKGSNHQREDETVAARDRLLELIGFNSVTYAPSVSSTIDTYVRVATPHPRTGFILTRNVGFYRRPVAFVFTGETQHQEGSEVFLDTALLDKSLNARLMNEGHVYPSFYTGLPTDLRNRLTVLANNARNQGRGLWPVDATKRNSLVSNTTDLESMALWPKLYRRLFKYFRSAGQGLVKFDAWLRADPDNDDKLWILSQGHLGNIHDIVTVSGNQITMNFDPEDLVMVPRQA